MPAYCLRCQEPTRMSLIVGPRGQRNFKCAVHGVQLEYLSVTELPLSNAAREALSLASTFEKTCEACGKQFIARKKGHRFCREHYKSIARSLANGLA